MNEEFTTARRLRRLLVAAVAGILLLSSCSEAGTGSNGDSGGGGSSGGTNPFATAVTVAGSATAASGSFGVERVTCPAGMVAVSGGVDVDNVLTMAVSSSGPTFDVAQARLYQQPDGTHPAPVGWQATAVNGAGSSQDLRVAALCAPVTGVSAIVVSRDVPAGSFAVQAVTCPAGTVAIGGGIDVENTISMTVTSNGPTFDAPESRLLQQPDGTNPEPNGWMAAAANAASSSQTFKVCAICAPVTGITTEVASDTVTGGTFGSERARCPAGTIAIGGGVDPYNILNMLVTSCAPTFGDSSYRLIQQSDGTLPMPDGWQASTLNLLAGSRTMKTAVICAPE